MKQISTFKILMGGILVAVAPISAQAVQFSILGQSEVQISGDVSYNIAERKIEFAIHDPVFCFDFSDATPQVRLRVTSDDNAVLLGGIGLTSALQYDVSNSRINLMPGPKVQCFYEVEGSFGLFGESPSGGAVETTAATNGGHIYSDQFQGDPKLLIEYEEFDSRDSATLDYAIIVKNIGTATVQRAAFQEIAPTSGLLPLLSVDCEVTGTADCGSNDGSGYIRFENLYLDPGSEVRLVVERSITSTLDGLELRAAVVSGDATIGKPAFDAKVKKIVLEVQ